jgi:hypothetical protein
MLADYAGEYVRTFNSLRPSLPPSPYSKRLIEARIFLAADGAVIFYVPEDAAAISPNFLPTAFVLFTQIDRRRFLCSAGLGRAELFISRRLA